MKVSIPGLIKFLSLSLVVLVTFTASLNVAKADNFAAQQTTIPEPATLLLLGSAISGIAALGRRWKANLKN